MLAWLGGCLSVQQGHVEDPPGLCTPRTWYQDRDGDGFGGPATTTACEVPAGFVATTGDCDDGDADLADLVGAVRYEEASAEAGLAGVGPSWDGSSRCGFEPEAGGAAVGDVDGDGDLDVFLPRVYLEDLLLLNDGTGVFARAPGWRGDAQGASNGAQMVDVDGDRDLDVVVTAVGRGPNLLYVNDGQGGFTEEARDRGLALDPGDECQDLFGVAAADVDLDGDLDLLATAWQEPLLLGRSHRTRLLLNDGTGHFADATAAWGVDALWERAAFSPLFADQDGDGDPDLHLVADYGGSGLFVNEGGRFVEATDRGVFTDEAGMGGDLADADGDGDLDWFVTAIWDPTDPCPEGWYCSGNRLYAAEDGGFVDATDAAGVREGQWGWGTAFADVDLDGTIDLVLTGGFTSNAFLDEPGRLYRGLGGGVFEDATCASGWVDRGQGRSVVPFDADRDGDPDLLVVGSAEEPRFWRNVGAEGRGWLAVELAQDGPNPFAIGARVTARGARGSQVRLLHANPAYVAGRPPEVGFGFGDDLGPYTVEVAWPEGVVTTHTAGVGLVRLTR